MLFVLVFAAVAAAAILATSWPLLAGVVAPPERGQFDRAVYRDQLRELDRDIARGLLSGAEAEPTRLEIQRRLLSVDKPRPVRGLRFARSPGVAAAVSLFVLTGAVALYLQIGTPLLPDAPYAPHPPASAAQPDARHRDLRVAAAKLAEKLHADPNNGFGWLLYARAESLLGEWGNAGDAYQHAISLGQTSAAVYAGLGEMRVLSMRGIVAPAAQDAFAKALAADPQNDVARYYLALADAQAGEEKRAIDSWMSLAARLPEDSPMREQIADGIQEAAKEGGIAAPTMPKGVPAPPATVTGGPSPQRMAAAAQMTPAQRATMIRGMVAQLAAKLRTEPNDPDGWMRLGRAYAVLGEIDKASEAYAHAAKLKPGDVDVRLQAVGMLLGGLKPGEPLPPEAVSLLNEVEAVAPNEPEALWYLGIVAAREGHPDVARADWTKLLGQMPPDGDETKLVKDALATLK